MGVFTEAQPIYARHGIATFPVRPDKQPAVRGYLKVTHPALSERLATRFAHC